MKKRIEFPLIELMLIIILLLILSFFALPKFMEVGSEARIKALNATSLNIASVNRLLYSRAVIKNVQMNALQHTEILGEKEQSAYLVYGELRAQKADLEKYLTSRLVQYVVVNEAEIRLYLTDYKQKDCYLSYHQASLSKVQNTIKKAYSRVKSIGC